MNNNIRYIITPTIAIAWFVAIVVSIVVNHPISTLQYEGSIAIGEVTYNSIWPVLLNSFIIIFISILLNHLSQHNEMAKTDNLLPILFFTLFQSLTPALIYHHLYTHLTTLLLLVIIALLYTCYQQHRSATQKMFVIGLLLSAATLFSAHIIYFLPLLIIGMIQMQVASARTIAATIVGIVTPYWILWGMGWVDIAQWDFSMLAITPHIPTFSCHIIPCIGVMLIGLLAGVSNLMNVFNENNKTRAKNGFINITSTYTALLLIIDNNNYLQYLPLLNSCVALQLCYFFTSRQGRAYNIMFYTLVLTLIAYTAWIYLFQL
ncbi:MAG: hypothetical protein IKM35_09135 [Bacteroidaceae bacterium]|nr:hypothetical protein [Bacteroidaceae bacterium]